MKMPNTKVIKPKIVELKPKIVDVNVRSKTVESLPARHSKVIHKKRASSCTRCNRSFSHQKIEITKSPTNTHVLKYEKKGKTGATFSKSQKTSDGQKDDTTRPEQRVIHEIQSHKAFTVIPPNPKKRFEIQKRLLASRNGKYQESRHEYQKLFIIEAEAELAALEDLRLSRAMGYISLAPSSVGGCLTLEEVRNKQQQEMQIRRKQRQVKRYDLQTSPNVIG